MKEKLIKLLLKHDIIKFNFKQPITFKSGIKSPIYCDFRKCAAYPEIMEIIKNEFIEMVNKEGNICEGIIGVATGAISHATLLANELSLPSGYIRPNAKAKDYGLGNLIEGMEVSGKNIRLLEDLISTGGSVLENALILKEAGAREIKIYSIFSYDMKISKEEFRQAGYEPQSIITIHDLLPYLKEQLGGSDYNLLRSWISSPENWFEEHKTIFKFGFLTQLRRSAFDNKSIVSMGVDPVLESLPKGYAEHGIEGYSRFMIDVFHAMKEKGVHAGMLKPNHGFYEVLDKPFNGTFEGSKALVEIIGNFKTIFPNVPVNLDFKRGDIGKSSANYAKVGFENWKSDALTIHAGMGEDSIDPFRKYCKDGINHGVYLLCKTSNSGSKDFQMLKLQDGKFNYEVVGEKIIQWAKDYPGVGAVLGGNSTDELYSIAKMFAGKDIPLLIPGVGDQGGTGKEVAQTLRSAGYELDLARINSSSKITHPWYKTGMTPDEIPPANECINMCCFQLFSLNKEIGFMS